MIQLSILKITEYGPWTLTLGSDREHELQMLQASLYKKVQELFSAKNCLVFLNKSDEFFVVSNGLTLDDHIEIQKSVIFIKWKSKAEGFKIRWKSKPWKNIELKRSRIKVKIRIIS